MIMLNMHRLASSWMICGQLVSYPIKYCPVHISACYKKSDSKYRPKKVQNLEKLGRIYYPQLKFFTVEKTTSFVKCLNDGERQQLFSELQKYQTSSNIEGAKASEESNGTVSSTQLKWLFFYNCIPFIGFGFLDNAIMILAGEYIDLTIGVTLGISTMAAAALGNLISDLCGLGLAGYVEVLCGRMGLPVPDFTAQQMELPNSRFASNLGKAIGVTIGCILGMFPLLFLKDKNEPDEE